MRRRLVLLVCLLTAAGFAADMVAYTDSNSTEATSGPYRAEHQHNWADRYDSSIIHRWPARSIFWSRNDYSHIRLFRDDREVFRKPTIAINELLLFPEEQLVFGISDVKGRNPYQLVVYDFEGKLLHAASMADREGLSETSTNFRTWKKRETPLQLTCTDGRVSGFRYVDVDENSQTYQFPKPLPHACRSE